MVLRMVFVCVLAITLVGCSTTKQPMSYDPGLQKKVLTLEESVAEKDKQISDLKYQVDDLSFQMKNLKSAQEPQDSLPSVSMKKEETSKSGNIVRVNADPKDIQNAGTNNNEGLEEVRGE
ncbi:MAG: hypothetical protein EOM53_05845 [Alphaproteobacteria bacterium]|nr:hypothetical protein [Alphaproteobacteria bacterium]